MIKNVYYSKMNGDVYYTQIDAEQNSVATLGSRMVAVTGGYIVFTDERWGKKRTIIQNASDISTIIIEE